MKDRIRDPDVYQTDAKYLVYMGENVRTYVHKHDNRIWLMVAYKFLDSVLLGLLACVLEINRNKPAILYIGSSCSPHSFSNE